MSRRHEKHRDDVHTMLTCDKQFLLESKEFTKFTDMEHSAHRPIHELVCEKTNNLGSDQV